jgi:transcriptional regulator with XRE-family HTH domain
MNARTATPPHRLYVSRAARKFAALPAHLRKAALAATTDGLKTPVCVICASDVLASGLAEPPPLSSAAETRYLVLVDVPGQALVRLPRALGLHRSEHRLYQTPDPGALRRLLTALARPEPMLGIVDAYVVGASLHLLTGDFEFRCFPIRKIPALSRLAAAERPRFKVDEDGSHLHWPALDIHLGVSQLLQETDPAFMADVAIRRSERDKLGPALRTLREDLGLRQSDIPGIGERQVHRIETGVSRLRYASAQKFAKAFRMTTGALLDDLAQRAAAQRTQTDRRRKRVRVAKSRGRPIGRPAGPRTSSVKHRHVPTRTGP